MVIQGLNFSPFFIALKCLIFGKRKRIIKMNLLKSDELGVPSTFLAIFANVTAMAGLQMVNVVFTSVISILSIVYLVYKIRNEIKKLKDNGKS
jgi:hypothetical protein